MEHEHSDRTERELSEAEEAAEEAAEEVEREEEEEDWMECVGGDSVFEQDHHKPSLDEVGIEETGNERRIASQLSPNAKLFSISSLLSSKGENTDMF